MLHRRLVIILQMYPVLTDGWADLLQGLMSARALGHEAFGPGDWDILNDLIHACEATVYRRRG